MVKNHKVFNFRSLDCGSDAEKKRLVFVSLLNLKRLPKWDNFRTFRVEIQGAVLLGFQAKRLLF